MKIKIAFKEIILLSILFTALALYFNIYEEKHVISFIINHVIALLIALFISKVIYHFLTKRK
jgi:hypothetical protein